MKRKIAKLFLLLSAVFLLCRCKSISGISTEFAALPPYTVIFSFDDGPNIHADTTSRLLDVLKNYEIKAMFSLLGENVEKAPDLVRRMYNEGHYLVNHGYLDKWAINMGRDEFRDNLVKGDVVISSVLGREFNPKLYRPHGGFYSFRHERICFEESYRIIHSDIRVYDAVLTEKSRDYVINEVINKVVAHGGGIILLHDTRDSLSLSERKLESHPRGSYNRSWVPEAVGEIIEILLDKGFTIGSPDMIIPKSF